MVVRIMVANISIVLVVTLTGDTLSPSYQSDRRCRFFLPPIAPLCRPFECPCVDMPPRGTLALLPFSTGSRHEANLLACCSDHYFI